MSDQAGISRRSCHGMIAEQDSKGCGAKMEIAKNTLGAAPLIRYGLKFCRLKAGFEGGEKVLCFDISDRKGELG